MTTASSGRKLRALTGATVLLVSALLAPAVPGIGLSGTAAAAGNEAPEVVRAVEYDGDIEVTFEDGVVQHTTANAGASSGTGDQLNENNFTVYVDGVAYGADDDFDVTYSSGTDPNGAGEDVAFTLVPKDSWGDLDPNRNVTVAINAVQADTSGGQVATPGGVDVTVTSRVVTGGGPNDEQVSAASAYQGGFLALKGSPGESIEVRGVGGAVEFVSNFGNSTVRAVKTTDYTAGATFRASFGSSTDQYFNVSDLQLTATADDTSIDPYNDLVVDVGAIRGGEPATATLRNADGDVVEQTVLTLDGGTTTRVNFGPQSSAGSPYTVTAVDNSTNVSATTAPVSVSNLDVGIDSAVEADGTVEVIFNATGFASGDGQPEAGDVDVWLDGTQVIDGGDDAGSNLGGLRWDVDPADFEHSGRRATFTITNAADAAIDIDPNRNLTVEFESVARTGARTSDPEAVATVTQAVVEEQGPGSADDPPARVYRGGDIAIVADSENADLFINTTGQDLTTGAGSEVLAIDTESQMFDTGEVTEVEFDGDSTNAQKFELRSLGLTATARQTTIGGDTDLIVDASANRGGAPVTATLVDGDGETVERRTTSLAGDGTLVLDFGTLPIGGGPYTATVVDNSTNTSATTAGVTVVGDATFDVSVDGTTAPVTAGETVSVDVTVANQASHEDTKTVELRAADGTVLDSRSVTLAGSASTTVTLDWSTVADDAGDPTLTVASPSDTATETVTVRRPTFAVDVTETNSPVTAGDLVAVTASVANRDVRDTQRIELIGPGDELLDATDVTLGGGSSTNVTLLWDASGSDVGDRTLTVASPRDEAATDVTVAPRVPLRLNATARDSWIDGDTDLVVDVSATRANRAVTATLSNADGTVETRSETTGTDGTLALNFGTQPAGEGPYTVTVTDDRTGDSDTTADVTVTDDAGFDVTVGSTNGPVTAGDLVAVTASVANRDGRDTQRIELLGPDDESLDAMNLTLEGGATTNVTLVWSTGPSDVGNRTLTVASASGSDSTTVEVAEQSTTEDETNDEQTNDEQTNDEQTNDEQTNDEQTNDERAPENRPPLAVGDSYVVREGGRIDVDAPGVLANDVDPENGSLTAAVGSRPTNGTLALLDSGLFVYEPADGFTGTDSFTYEARDGDGGTDTATVEITVRAVNDPPTATGDDYAVDATERLAVDAPGVLANDADPEGADLRASLVDGPSHGVVELAENGAITYVPDRGFSGRDTVTYRVSDGDGGTDTATVEITVEEGTAETATPTAASSATATESATATPSARPPTASTTESPTGTATPTRTAASVRTSPPTPTTRATVTRAPGQPTADTQTASADGTGSQSTGGSGPGFGVGVALFAAVGAAALLRREG